MRRRAPPSVGVSPLYRTLPSNAMPELPLGANSLPDLSSPPRRVRLSLRMRRSLGLATALGAPALAACARAGLPEGATRESGDLAWLWGLFFWAGLGVTAIVSGLILWAVIRFRQRDGRELATFREHVPLELVYTVIPIAIVVALFGFTARTMNTVNAPADDPVAVVNVDAFNWSWRFSYPDAGITIEGTPDDPPELVVPVGDPVRINLRSEDVIHAFFVSDFLFKRDAIPGQTNTFDFTVEEPGVYGGQCAEFCGLDHARMRFTVRAVPLAEFESWLASEGSPS